MQAFFGNTLHESDAFRAPREYSMCKFYDIVGDEVFCQVPDTNLDDPLKQYCSVDHKDPPVNIEDGCNCALQIPDTLNDKDWEPIPANELYFGRGK